MLDSQIAKVKDTLSAVDKIQQQHNKSPKLTYLNTFMDQADITAKNIELTDKLNQLEYQREQAVSKVERTQKLVNDASALATQKAIEQAGAVSILKGAYDLLNRSMSARSFRSLKPLRNSRAHLKKPVVIMNWPALADLKNSISSTSMKRKT